ncbi:hypothetical protein TSOC_002709 [Tetrabaena socialis]|uniref:MYND-type domain-containing protein n=1 Tax=Tetrabaena socialis TaxID=47790 RepID=A0A2J8ADG1_9CHLO|nr:hypothetical protein TSOC_002709 [Tetrabaena socialis]|eukprot:PNH10552.1 hypothetical protein TSOC_002709 [Tetrabaena socialis]
MMQAIPPVLVFEGSRSVQNHACVTSDATWLQVVQSARTAPGAAEVYALNPFERSTTRLVVPTTFVQEQSGIADTWSVTRHPGPDILRASLPAMSAKLSAVAEDLVSGSYVGCYVQLSDLVAPKEPGFSLFGRPFVGRALVVRGRELRSQRNHIFDEWTTVLEDDLATLQWLSVGDARVARQQHGASASRMAAALQADRSRTILCGITSVLPTDRHATCWACARRGVARHKCGVCKAAYYCSRDCQTRHWPDHRLACALPNF